MHNEIIETVKAYPGLTHREIAELNPELTPHQVMATLLDGRLAKLIRSERSEQHMKPLIYFPADGTPDFPMRNFTRTPGRPSWKKAALDAEARVKQLEEALRFYACAGYVQFDGDDRARRALGG